ncbi:MAG: M67 family metallopeptidase [bacterium]|nr:M67 family metallopeptidase [bacterium]
MSVEPAPTELRLPANLRRDLEGLAEASYPFEACGVMIGRSDAGRSGASRSGASRVSVDAVFHARNLRVDRPHDRYLLDPADHLAAHRAARARGLDVVGFWHSHPDRPAKPSVTDLEAAWKGYSYLIVSAPAAGASTLRSWRLSGGRFLEETIR